MNTQSEKCQTLAALHASQDIWMIPNPWDVGSAKDLEALGFKALATSSAAFAHTLGKKDGEVSIEEKLTHCEALSKNTTVPLHVDFEDGFSHEPLEVAANIRRLVETGVAGCSIEDFSRTQAKVFDFTLAVERVQAAAEVIAGFEIPFQLTARAENLLRKHADIDDTIKRLQAFANAGAHVLYAPGLATLEQVKLISNNTDKPLNVLSPFLPGVSLQALGEAGVTRVSFGSALQNNMRSNFLAGMKELLSSGLAS